MLGSREREKEAISVVGALVNQRLARNRWHAQQLVSEGCVYFKKHRIEHDGEMVSPSVPLHIRKTFYEITPRDSSNLQYGLERFRFSSRSRVCAVLGRSNGCAGALLKGGARRVFTVNLKNPQYGKPFGNDTRVTSIEILDLQHLNHGFLPLPLTGIVVNCREKKLEEILPMIQNFAIPGCWMLAFVHLHIEAPQEMNSEVPDDLPREVAQRIRTLIENRDNWHVIGAVVAPIREGGDMSNMLMVASEHTRRSN